MTYRVQSGDSLWRIAQRELGDPGRWREIATVNQIRPTERLLIGQKLFLPMTTHHGNATLSLAAHPPEQAHTLHVWERQPPLLPAWFHVFVLADEMNPLTRKVVRKIAYPKKPLPLDELERILRPDKYGLDGIKPESPVSLGRHVLGNTQSRFISSSDRALGSPRFDGKPYWINVDRAKAAGVQFHETADINKDLTRISARANKPGFKEYIEDIRKLSQQTDREAVMEGHVPATAIKGPLAEGLTHGFRIIGGVGIAISVYDVGKAAQQSVQQHSIVPITKEGIKQGAGWTAGAIGRTAGTTAFSWAARWAAAEEGAELGGVGGAAVGIETGPGALITGAAGALLFGTAAFFGAEWATNKIFGGK